MESPPAAAAPAAAAPAAAAAAVHTAGHTSCVGTRTAVCDYTSSCQPAAHANTLIHAGGCVGLMQWITENFDCAICTLPTKQIDTTYLATWLLVWQFQQGSSMAAHRWCSCWRCLRLRRPRLRLLRPGRLQRRCWCCCCRRWGCWASAHREGWFRCPAACGPGRLGVQRRGLQPIVCIHRSACSITAHGIGCLACILVVYHASPMDLLIGAYWSWLEHEPCLGSMLLQRQHSWADKFTTTAVHNIVYTSHFLLVV